MAKKPTKSSTKHIPSTNHESTTSHSTPWPNLPQQLIASIARQPKLMQNITSFCVVHKDWRRSLASRQCDPDGELPLPQLSEMSNVRHLFPNLQRSYICEIPFHGECHSWRHFKGHSHGQIITIGSGSWSDSCLWELAGKSGRYLAQWDYNNLRIRGATLSSFPDDRRNGCSVMVLLRTRNNYNPSPSFAFFRRGKGEKAWTLRDCTIRDPYGANNENMDFVNAIGFRGKFYVLSLQGSLVVIEYIGSCFRITKTRANRAVPSKPCRYFDEYLLESNGEILLVFLIYEQKSFDLVEDVEVLRLDTHKALWVKVESLGDWTLFLQYQCCMGVKASQVGCKNNSVHFVRRGTDNKWWIFDMENGRILPAFTKEVQESAVCGSSK